MNLRRETWWALAALVHAGGLRRDSDGTTWRTPDRLPPPYSRELVDELIEQGAAIYTLAAPDEITPTEAGVRYALEQGLVDAEAARDRFQEQGTEAEA